MNDIHPSLERCVLFKGIIKNDLTNLLACLKARRQEYGRDEYILSAGDKPSEVGIILQGSANIIREDYWGNRSLIQKLQATDVFAESIALARNAVLPFSVVSAGNTLVVYLDAAHMLKTCGEACAFHTRLIFNIVQLLAHKNIMLTRKMEHIAMRSTREKLLSYLSSQALESGGGSFAIPYNRQELADYLCVDRSALSAVLSGLKSKGVLDYNRNHFWMIKRIEI